MLRALRRASVGLIALCAFAGMAQAYVLPADFLLKLLADKRRGAALKDVQAVLATELDGTDTPVDEHLYLKSPERLRVVTQGEEASVYVEREGQRAQGPEGGKLERRGAAVDLTAALLAPGGKDGDEAAARMLATLKAHGVETSVVTFGRLDDTIAYVIGARAFEPDKPQLWLYKSTTLPLRAIVYEKTSSPPVKVETRWLEWGSQVGGDYLPGVIEVYRDGKRVRRAELVKITTNAGIPEALFDLPKK